MFDLPTDTKKARKEYALFRKKLLETGFTKMQFSVYTRFTLGTENAEKYVRQVKSFLPPGGEVRILSFTDKQFERMYIFFGKKRQPIPKQWEQLTFF
jgi:CRISPR-associated protein Cas2